MDWRVEVGLNPFAPRDLADFDLTARMWEGISSLETSGGLDLLLRYQEPGGAAVDRAVAGQWLSERIPWATAERLLICPGTQGALLSIAGILSAPGDSICTESLTYPGFRSLAAHLRIPLIEVATDSEGVLPESFRPAYVPQELVLS
jgi:DNA-binding transcriptional MocR family regulator